MASAPLLFRRSQAGRVTTDDPHRCCQTNAHFSPIGARVALSQASAEQQLPLGKGCRAALLVGRATTR